MNSCFQASMLLHMAAFWIVRDRVLPHIFLTELGIYWRTGGRVWMISSIGGGSWLEATVKMARSNSKDVDWHSSYQAVAPDSFFNLFVYFFQESGCLRLWRFSTTSCWCYCAGYWRFYTADCWSY